MAMLHCHMSAVHQGIIDKMEGAWQFQSSYQNIPKPDHSKQDTENKK